MKKIILAVSFILASFSMVSAEIGVNVGVSGNLAVFHATGVDKDTNTAGTSTEISTDDETGVAGYTSFFIEKTLGDRFTIGYDYVSSSLESETEETVVDDLKGETDGASTQVTNTVKVAFEDLSTLYVALNLTENLYVKGGLATVDVITKETLATGSDYGNTSLDGSVMGVGYNKSFDNGMFLRVEGTYMDFDNAKLTSKTNSDNTIELNDLEGASGKLSIGKSF
tara:strand:+ start:140 stop:814 length:675 start_codon:yes stop_codon:yes gene_type:complete